MDLKRCEDSEGFTKYDLGFTVGQMLCIGTRMTQKPRINANLITTPLFPIS